jgi:F-type H+-transporting ATPase subunit b
MNRERTRGRKSPFFVVFLSIICFLLYGMAFAAGGGEGGDRSGDLLDLLYRFINFALLVIILFWAVKKAGIKDFFSARTQEIRQRLDELKKGKDEAETRFKEMEKMQAARDRLKQEVLDLSAQKAEEIIAKGMTDKDQDRLVDEFIEKVGKIH